MTHKLYKSNRLWIWFYVCLPVIVASCALYGPDYKKPKVVSPTSWKDVSVNPVTTKINLSDVAWWAKFNDPVLNGLIQEALENNNDIQGAIGNMIVASGKLKQVKMGWVPTINLSAGGAVGQTLNQDTTMTPSLPVPFGNSSGIDFNLYNAGLIPSYTLNIMQQLRKQDVAQANVMLASAAKNAVRLGVISQVAGSYFTLLAAEEEKEIQERLINNLSQVIKILNIQIKHGLIVKNDIVSYEQNLAEAKMQLPLILHNIVMAQNALSALTNKNPQQLISGRKFSALVVDGVIPINLPSQVLANRPDIIQAEEQLKLGNANIGVATSNFFPSIMLTTPIGGYSSQLSNLFGNNSVVNGIAMPNTINSSGDYWAVQAAAVMPILNLGLYGIIKQAKGQYYIAYYNYMKTVRNAFAEVNNGLSWYTQSQKMVDEMSSLCKTIEVSDNLNQINYQNGYTSYPQSLSSKVSLDSALMKVNQAKLAKLQSIVQLYQSMAGGYNYKNNDAPKKFGDSHDA